MVDDLSLTRVEDRSGDVDPKTSDWLWEIDSAGYYTYSNARVEEILGYRVDEILGAHFFDVVDPREGPEFSAIVTGATREKAPFRDVPRRSRGKDGREVWLETSGTPLLGENGVLIGYRGLDREVTERWLAPWPGSPIGVTGESISLDAEPCVWRWDRHDDETVNLSRVVAESLALLPAARRSRVITSLARDLLPITGSPADLRRVVLDLLASAGAAVASRGSIAVTTENLYVDEPTGRDERIEVGEYVRLTVWVSRPPRGLAVREMRLDSGLTTTTTGRRVRLGLALARTIIRRHDGHVDVASEADRAIRVDVYLPVDRDVLRESQFEGMTGGCETVLIVDDDVEQRELATRGLRSLGYQTQAVVSGEEAVVYLSRREADLVILDMVMPPGIDGAEAYRRIREVRPGQRAIVVSGGAESDRTRAAQTLGAGAYLRKPVTLAALARAVRRELDGGRGR